MEQGYRIDICRERLLDCDIPVVSELLNRHLGVETVTFNRAFKQSKTLSFESFVDADDIQACVSRLNEYGIKSSVEKVVREKQSVPNRETSLTLDNPQAVAAISESDFRLLLSGNLSTRHSLTRYKTWVSFASGVLVFSSYLLMVYSSY